MDSRATGNLIDVRNSDPGEDLFARGLTDGLLVEIPTPDRVSAYVAASGRGADELIARSRLPGSPARIAVVGQDMYRLDGQRHWSQRRSTGSPNNR